MSLLEDQYIYDDQPQQINEPESVDVESSQEQTQESTEDNGDGQNSEGAEQNAEHPQNTQQKPKHSINERFRHYSASLKQKDAEIRALREQLNKPNVQQSPQQPEELPPDPNDPKFKTVEDYFTAKATYTARQVWKEQEAQRIAKEQEERAKAEMYKINQEWNRKLQQGQKEFADWDHVVENSPVSASDELAKEIMESEIGHKVAYHLAKNPDEVERLNRMPYNRMLKEFGKIEATLNVKATAPRLNKPPPPSGLKSTGQAGTTIDKSKIPMSEYYKLKMQGKI